jgi:DNA repair ATPase RecN
MAETGTQSPRPNSTNCDGADGGVRIAAGHAQATYRFAPIVTAEISTRPSDGAQKRSDGILHDELASVSEHLTAALATIDGFQALEEQARRLRGQLEWYVFSWEREDAEQRGPRPQEPDALKDCEARLYELRPAAETARAALPALRARDAQLRAALFTQAQAKTEAQVNQQIADLKALIETARPSMQQIGDRVRDLAEQHPTRRGELVTLIDQTRAWLS